MLPKHPDQMGVDELAAWVEHLVAEGVEEGPTLDYKRELDLGKLSAKRDLFSKPGVCHV